MLVEVYRNDGAGRVVRRFEPLPALGDREVRVGVRAVGLNFRDLGFVRGDRTRSPVPDRIPATDASGVVEAIGAAVTRFQAGDRVCTTVLPQWLDGPLTPAGFAVSLGSRQRDGVLARTLQMHEDELVRAPAHLSDREAATLPVAALTAWHAVHELGAVRPGDTVVVQTTGGVAVFALQFARAIGARVIVVSRSADKLARATSLGASAVVDTSRTPDWPAAVLELTRGRGAELVIDMGLTDGLRASTRAAAFEGTVAIVGVVQENTNPLDIYTVMNRNLRVRGVETGSRAMFERMTAFMACHAIVPVVDAAFGFDQADAALSHLAGSPFGKVVIDVDRAAA